MSKIITKPLVFEPYGVHPDPKKPHCALGFDGQEYWASDNGCWDSAPEKSDAHPEEELEANRLESTRVAELLNEDALNVLRANGFDV